MLAMGAGEFGPPKAIAATRDPTETRSNTKSIFRPIEKRMLWYLTFDVSSRRGQAQVGRVRVDRFKTEFRE
jgi:hypothetical protein